LTEKRRKLGDCEAVIDELWAAIEALPDPEPETDAKPIETGRGHCHAAATRGGDDR